MQIEPIQRNYKLFLHQSVYFSTTQLVLLHLNSYEALNYDSIGNTLIGLLSIRPTTEEQISSTPSANHVLSWQICVNQTNHMITVLSLTAPPPPACPWLNNIHQCHPIHIPPFYGNLILLCIFITIPQHAHPVTKQQGNLNSLCVFILQHYTQHNSHRWIKPAGEAPDFPFSHGWWLHPKPYS